ncbi:MAG TPA: methanogenesis marker 17 protein [Candidatus Methanomethylophilaceae archaeon]|nr:methanogenesis marker 17 protein [Candidatus Methanomethylophilaceae archaeon]
MEMTVEGTDPFGNEGYETLFKDIMYDLGDASSIEKAHLLLKPEIPLFVFSVKMRSEPADKRIPDVSSVRKEGTGVHITITDERYAPQILDAMWSMYGRDSVEQQTRFDMTVENANIDKVNEVVVASGEETLREIIGSVWRSMPEGIRVRHVLITGTIVTVIATEELMTPEIRKEGEGVHIEMGGSIDV